MKKFAPVLLALTLAVSARSVLADSPGATNDATVLPETVITGHVTPTSLTSPSAFQAGAEQTEVPGGFTIKGVTEMQEGRSSNFQDLFQNTPGLFLQSENGVEASKVSVRGSGILSDEEPTGVTFLMDGLNFTEGDGEASLENVDVGTLKYAEVYRGADALKYGSLMLGGAINLIPHTGYDADPFAVRLELGSYGFARSQISGGGVDGPVDYYGSVMGRYRDGYRDHSRENTGLLFTDVGYKITPTMENRVYVTLDETTRQIPGGLTKHEMQTDPRAAGADAAAQNLSTYWNFLRLADKLSVKTADCEVNAGAFWYHVNQESRALFSVDDPDGIELYEANNFGALLNTVIHGEILGHNNHLTLGITPEYEDEKPRNFENLNGRRGAETASGEGEHFNLPVYAENQFYITQPLSVITGIQFIYVRREFIDHYRSDGDASAVQNFYGLNPKLGTIYEFNDKTQAYLNFSRSWQPPSLDNSLRFAGGGGSPELYQPLNPQHAWTVELGTRGEHGRFDWDLSLYHSWVRDELLELRNPAGESLGATNYRHTEHQGIEAGLDIELLNPDHVQDNRGRTRDQLTLKQTYTFTDCHFENDATFGNNRLPGIPVHLYEASLIYQAACGFYAGPDLQCNITHYPVDQANSLFVDPYALLGWKMGYRWKKLQVFVEAKNLLDTRYPAAVDVIADAHTQPDPDSFHPGDGRSFYGGASWAW